MTACLDDLSGKNTDHILMVTILTLFMIKLYVMRNASNSFGHIK